MGLILVNGYTELAESVGTVPTSAMPILFSRQVQPAASARAPYLPAFQKWLPELDSHQHRLA